MSSMGEISRNRVSQAAAIVSESGFRPRNESSVCTQRTMIGATLPRAIRVSLI